MGEVSWIALYNYISFYFEIACKEPTWPCPESSERTTHCRSSSTPVLLGLPSPGSLSLLSKEGEREKNKMKEAKPLQFLSDHRSLAGATSRFILVQDFCFCF